MIILITMYFFGEISKGSKTELSHLKLIPYWHRPGGGLQEIFDHMKKKGLKNFGSLEKEYIEVYVGSLIALALEKQDNTDFWIAKTPSQYDPPDIVVMTIKNSEKVKGATFDAREIEVRRAMSINEELIDGILKKDENKYPDKYILACFVEVPGIYDLIALSKNLAAKLKNIKNVVLVFHGAHIPDITIPLSEKDLLGMITIAQVHPVFESHQINILDALREWRGNAGKLIYTRDAQIWWGKRSNEEEYPKIINFK